MKFIFLVCFLSLLLYIFPSNARASLVVVKTSGEVIINVLASEDDLSLRKEDSELNLERVVGGEDTPSEVSLTKSDGKIALNVGTKEIDVTNLKEDLIEVEEKPQIKKVTVRLEGQRFLIKQAGIAALTDFPVSINSKENKFSLTTDSGVEFLPVLPFDAAQGILKTRLITQISRDPLELKKDERGLFYEIKGDKVIDIFGLYDFKIPVTAKVSALTGEIRTLDNPEWLKFVSFLFV